MRTNCVKNALHAKTSSTSPTEPWSKKSAYSNAPLPNPLHQHPSSPALPHLSLYTRHLPHLWKCRLPFLPSPNHIPKLLTPAPPHPQTFSYHPRIYYAYIRHRTLPTQHCNILLTLLLQPLRVAILHCCCAMPSTLSRCPNGVSSLALGLFPSIVWL